MARVAVQTYSFGETAVRDLPGVLTRLAGIGYRAVETFETHGWPVKDIRAILTDLEIDVAGAHYDFPVGETASATLDTAAELGTPYIVWSLEPEEFATVDLIKHGVERINEAAENARPYGIKIAVHNHGAEFSNVFEGRYAYEYLKELVNPEVDFEFDMYWAALEGGDVAQIIRDLGPRVHHLHVKDGPVVSPADDLLPAGTGKVDIAGAVTANPAVDWHIVEFDRTAGDMFDAVEGSYRYLTGEGFSER